VLREETAPPGNSQTVCSEPSETSKYETLIHSSSTESIEVRLVISGPRHRHQSVGLPSAPGTAGQLTPPVFLIKFEGRHSRSNS